MSLTSLILMAVICTIVVTILSRQRPARLRDAQRQLGKAFRALLRDRRELILFALVEVVAIAALALLLLAVGPGVSGIVLVAGAGILAIWAITKPPATRR